MKQVNSYKSDDGRLYPNKEEAIAADLVQMVENWGDDAAVQLELDPIVAQYMVANFRRVTACLRQMELERDRS